MSGVENPIIWLLGIPALGILLFVLRNHFRAREQPQHRRGQSHRPVISQETVPSPRPAAAAGKAKRDVKG